MSIAIAVMGNNFVLAGADSKTSSTDGKTNKVGAEKLFTANLNGSHIAIAIAGDAMINGKDTIEIVREVAAVTNADNFKARLTDRLRTEWKDDINNYKWESTEDRTEHENAVKVDFLVIESPYQISVIRISLTESSQQKPVEGWRNCAIGKLANIQGQLAQNEVRDLNSATEWLSTSLEIVCQTETSCAYPIRLMYWLHGNQPKFDWAESKDKISLSTKRLASLVEN